VHYVAKAVERRGSPPVDAPLAGGTNRLADLEQVVSGEHVELAVASLQHDAGQLFTPCTQPSSAWWKLVPRSRSFRRVVPATEQALRRGEEPPVDPRRKAKLERAQPLLERIDVPLQPHNVCLA
jgi:hypothetical protein